MITVLLNDNGDKVTLDAEAQNVTMENGSLIIRRNKHIVGRFRRHLAWWEQPTNNDEE